ncbi:MAG: histidine kinase [Nitrospirae bacterium]|nr:histidine kinase [Candidatus Manganitrophaceae bacterium]
MKIFRPKSVLSLVLIGFSLVTLPLIFSLVYAVISVDRLLDQSQKDLFQAVQATKGSITLVEQIKKMERNIRQFQVLGDETLFQLYEKSHQELQNTANTLSQLSEGKQRDSVSQLMRSEKELYHSLKRIPHDAEEGKIAVTKFTALAALAQLILTENRGLVNKKIELMERRGKETQQLLVWQAMGITPIVLALVIVFTLLIARPIRQIDQAIRKLGDNTLPEKITISGPKDLQVLGTRLDWLRSRLKELEEQKIQFLRHISHELKTPLTASRAGAELLRDEVVGTLNREQRKVVEILHQSMIALQKMIENLLNFGVVLERHAMFTLTPVVMGQLIEKVLTDHRLTLMARKIHVDLKLSTQSISGDENKLSVVLDNLVSNAIKFSPIAGTIEINLTEDGHEMRLDVIDAGPGIDPDDKARVFDPFYQGRRQAETEVEGTGIGLSLAKEYVLAHHGTIEILENEGEKGAHLCVKLPINPFKEL